MKEPKSQFKPVVADIHEDIVKDVERYIKKHEKALRRKGLHDKSKLIRWFMTELAEGRIDPCKS